MVSNSRTVNNIIGALLAIILTFLCFGSTYAVEPEKPWPEDLGDGDRLYASYLNGMFGVLYNWCQNKQIILDNLLNNGNGVASVTARLGKFDNLSVPELDNLLHNGNGIASLTSNLLKALQEVEAPLYKVNGRADAPSVNTDDGYIYYDIDTQRLMGYQEGHWRDLSPVTVVGTDSLHSPLIIEGYLETTNSYVENRVVIGNASESHNEIGTASAKIDFGNDGAIRIPVNSNPNQLNTEFGTGSIAYNPTTKKLLVYDGTSWISPVPEITVDSSISSTSTNPVQNKEVYRFIAQTESNSFYYIAEAIRNVVKNVHNQMTDITGVPALNSWPIGGTTSHATPLLQEAYESFKALIDYVRTATLNSAKTYADSKDTTTLNSAKTYADSAAATALNSAKTYADGKTTTNSSLSVKTVTTSGNATVGGNLTVSGSSNNIVNGDTTFRDDISMVQGTNLTADNLTADTGKFDDWLRLPTSTSSSAPTGSLAYNSTAQKLQYKDANGWKDIVSQGLISALVDTSLISHGGVGEYFTVTDSESNTVNVIKQPLKNNVALLIQFATFQLYEDGSVDYYFPISYKINPVVISQIHDNNKYLVTLRSSCAATTHFRWMCDSDVAGTLHLVGPSWVSYIAIGIVDN